MIKKAAYFLFLSMISATVSFGQVTYLPLNTNDNLLLDRLQTRSGRENDTLNLVEKPESRKRAVEFLMQQQQNARYTELSAIDRYNIAQNISENGEWTPDGNGAIDSKHPWFNTFYKKQYDFIYAHTNNFFVVVNPIISGEVFAGKNSDGTTYNGYWTERGAEIRGWISKKIGFYTSATDNQEKPPPFVNDWIQKYQAVPGADYYIPDGTTRYDYLLATGYFDFAIIKDHLNASFGFGKNFIGDGVESMFLSDFSSSTPFLKLKTHIWKINYENLYLELTPQYTKGNDTLLLHKYATMQHLSMNVTKWLNVGLFESIIFDRINTYEFAYLDPVIFLASTEQFLGDGDKKHLGMDFKAIAAKHLQFYGQFLLDEFTAKDFFSHNGYWANKWALQLGGKYFDAFTVKNLDLQGELDVVRPYTYTAADGIANYTNYNQPLADPLGANFIQIIGIARYQPAKKLFLTMKGMYYMQGVDTGGLDYGGNIFLSYNSRTQDYGVRILQGVQVNSASLNFNVSYELKPNLFIDLGATHRRYIYENDLLSGNSTTYTYCGIRLNIARRDYDFY